MPPLTGARDAAQAAGQLASDVQQFIWLAVWAVTFFFVVLLIGFAYEWKTGALDWVRALTAERRASEIGISASIAAERDSVLSA